MCSRLTATHHKIYTAVGTCVAAILKMQGGALARPSSGPVGRSTFCHCCCCWTCCCCCSNWCCYCCCSSNPSLSKAASLYKEKGGSLNNSFLYLADFSLFVHRVHRLHCSNSGFPLIQRYWNGEGHYTSNSEVRASSWSNFTKTKFSF